MEAGGRVAVDLALRDEAVVEHRAAAEQWHGRRVALGEDLARPEVVAGFPDDRVKDADQQGDRRPAKSKT